MISRRTVFATLFFFPAMAMAFAATIPFSEEVERLSSKNISYWFITLAAIAIGSWSFMGRLLLKQLSEQRDANAALTESLIAFLKGDRMETQRVVTECTNVMSQVVDLLKTLNQERHDAAVLREREKQA